jgi:DNA polymerase I-like protein with 3'-5' exonuclease and polymerase domains
MLVFDTESDGFLDDATKLHVINLIDRETGAREAYHDHPEVSTTNLKGSLKDGAIRLGEALLSGRQIAGHNIIRHDIPLIDKFFPGFWAAVPRELIVDTLVASRLIWTDLEDIDNRALKKGKRPTVFREKRLVGRHSLEAWGYRLGFLKGDFSGPWDTFTPEMADYGIQDPEVTLALVEKIEAENYSEEAIRLEHRVAEIIFLQERHGFWFDTDAAERLEIELTAEKARLEDELRSAFAPWYEPERYKGKIVEVDPKRRRTAGVASEDGEQWRSSYEPGEPYCKVKLVSFEPGSRDKIANRLKALMGWTPVDFTPTGKPKVDETTLGGLDYPEAKLLIRYLTVDKRLGQLATGDEAWLKRVKPDHRLHGRVNTNGAITGRMTHSGPNMAQVPAIRVDDSDKPLLGFEGGYGVESRRLFTAAPGKVLVGVDAEGLELRMLAHYMARYDGGAYVDTVVNGKKADGTDVHSVNRKAIGLNSRYNAKTWTYAYLYGAGDLKLGKIAYDDMTEQQRVVFNSKHSPGAARERAMARLGGQKRKRIENSLPALGELQKAIKTAIRSTKQLRSVDGRMLNIRAQHSALNTLLQGGGAVVMKKALVLAYDSFLEEGWSWGEQFAFVVNVHDEFQMEADPPYAEQLGRISAEAIRLAGEAFDLRCPLSGSADSGQTWADTH